MLRPFIPKGEERGNLSDLPQNIWVGRREGTQQTLGHSPRCSLLTAEPWVSNQPLHLLFLQPG